MALVNKFNETIKVNNMINEGVIACVSGGADSICMLYLLFDYCLDNNKKLICAHFNHGIRGNESDGDEKFVQSVCSELNIELITAYEEVPKLAEKLSMGIEEAARKARYEFFDKLAKEYNYTIAVAHNRNDRLETIIHNILRGTSIEGLKGIIYVRDNIVRPLLDISREEIEEYLRKNNIEFINDSSNYDIKYTRNRIRHKIIPFLKQQYSENIDDALLRLSDLSIQDSEYLNNAALTHFRNVVIVDKKISIDVLEYSMLHYSIRSRMLKTALSLVRNENDEYIFIAGTGIEMSTINRIDDFILNGSSGKYVEASKDVIAKKEYDKVFLLYNDNIETTYNKVNYKSEIVSISDFDKNLLNDNSCVCFDYEELINLYKKDSIVLRTRQEGDLFRPFGFNGTKKLQKFFKDEKIPVSKRDSILLLARDSDILWIPQIRRSQIAPIDNNTKNVIIIRLHEENMEDKL